MTASATPPRHPYAILRLIMEQLEKDEPLPPALIFEFSDAISRERRSAGTFEAAAAPSGSHHSVYSVLTHPKVTPHLLLAIKRWMSVETIEPLQSCMRTWTDPDLRRIGVRCLGFIAGPPGVQALLFWVREGTDQLREEARLQLEQIANGYDPTPSEGSISFSPLAEAVWKEHRTLLLGTDIGLLIAQIEEACGTRHETVTRQVLSALEPRILGTLIALDHDRAEQLVSRHIVLCPNGYWLKRLSHALKHAELLTPQAPYT